MIRVPGVAAGAKQGAFCCAGDTVFGCIGFADEDNAGIAKTFDEFAILVVHRVGDETASACAGPAFNLGPQVFNEKRNALERPTRQVCFRSCAGFVIRFVDDRVKCAIVGLNSFNGGLHELRRFNFTFVYQLGKTKAVIVCILL